MREVGLPRAPEGEETWAYSLAEIEGMLSVLPQPAFTLVAVAAFTGLRRAELRGLEWQDYDGTQISVKRSIWESHVNEPKTRKSKAPVPMIPKLARILDHYRLTCGNPQSGPMFSNSKGRSENLNNTLHRTILPALNRCSVCKEQKTAHIAATVSHEFQRDDNLPVWHGWHGFRRGLATNLYQLGVPDKVIQQILRHANVSTTMNIYVKTVSADSTAAMQKLDAALCADSALASLPPASRLTN
jgi:integrase